MALRKRKEKNKDHRKNKKLKNRTLKKNKATRPPGTAPRKATGPSLVCRHVCQNPHRMEMALLCLLLFLLSAEVPCCTTHAELNGRTRRCHEIVAIRNMAGAVSAATGTIPFYFKIRADDPVRREEVLL